MFFKKTQPNITIIYWKLMKEKEPFWLTPNPRQGNKAHKGCSRGERKETTKQHQKESLQCETTNVYGRWKRTESINDFRFFSYFNFLPASINAWLTKTMFWFVTLGFTTAIGETCVADGNKISCKFHGNTYQNHIWCSKTWRCDVISDWQTIVGFYPIRINFWI